MNATHRCAVLARRHLTPRTVRLTLGGPSLLGLTPHPAQDIEILLTDTRGSRVKRRYTIRHARPQIGEWDIDAVLHPGGGPGSAWAASAQPGAPVEFVGPRGKLRLRPADGHLFVGDEASLPAIAALTEALPAGQEATAVIETASAADRVPIAAGRLRWLERGDRLPGAPEGLLAVVTQEIQARSFGQVYVLAEARATRAVRELVHSSGIRPDHVFAKGYWTADRHPAVTSRNPT
ncbi:siderophore-interacting protein [Embleya scabrispora]|uniref:siderophore-interacting protein n=1 Tax=Embleya scabrispora TaxID=159449 RepID=UPI0003774C75|nr:siderophore-interacting protein [Embleya scabrispora]MYS80468.1 SIP domain-containing protein [Streptomyces sp. SID5474]